uniref:Major Facilitator Superfamily (MFS) putative n=1 Tax=Albugo laibachii Nc14 TaxID=890382 RepID=F0WMI0_9STRA|nr:Major Facilitator Superfamily (MFS) putative [Albugo laibachii Nc14]|eukprot:CCA22512.1 Major Facilitator Superfamily (MFS) putative [Albugo laibachii Nc14]
MTSSRSTNRYKESKPLYGHKICGDHLWAPKAMYAISSAGQSALINYLPIYYQHTAQFTKWQIGVLQTLPCVCALIAPPLWGAVADKLDGQRLVHNICIISSAIISFSIQLFHNYDIYILLIVSLGFFQAAPCGSLQDHAVLDMLAKVGGEYGKQRLFGAVGYGLGAYISALVVGWFGIKWSFNLMLILTLLSVVVLRHIPAISHAHDHDDESNALMEANISDSEIVEKRKRKKASFSDNMTHLLAHQFDVLVLLLVVFLLGLMFGVISSFLTLNLYNLSGGNPQIIGIAIMCETASELPAFFYSHQIINKLGVVGVLLLSTLGYALRISYYWYMTNPWTAIPFELLHGMTFGLAWASCTQYIFASAQPGFEGTMMGMLNAVQNGLGRGAGTLIGGYLYQSYGPKTMWMLTDMGVPVALLGIGVFAFLKSRDSAGVTLQDEEAIRLESAQIFSPHSADPQSILRDFSSPIGSYSTRADYDTL